MGKVHAHIEVARAHHGKIHGHIRLGPGMRLHIGVLCAEELHSSLPGQLFNLIDEHAAAVIALPRISFRVLVGEDAALGLHDCRRGKILRRNQFKAVFLTISFLCNDLEYFFVGVLEGTHFLKGFLRTGNDKGDTSSSHSPCRFKKQHQTYSRFSICSTLLAWRPPSNRVSNQTRSIEIAKSEAVTLPPNTRTLESLCRRLIRA
jgi:hypothetical protein